MKRKEDRDIMQKKREKDEKERENKERKRDFIKDQKDK